MALAMVAPAPGRIPTKKPITDERSVAPVQAAASLALNSMRPVLRTSVWPLLVLSSISRISETENRPITTTINCTPSERCTLSNVKRYTPVLASTPTVASPRPISAARNDFSGFCAIMLPRQAMAKTIRAKYSAGPNASDHSASTGAKRMMPKIAINEPTNELTAEIESATPPRPCCAIG